MNYNEEARFLGRSRVAGCALAASLFAAAAFGLRTGALTNPLAAAFALIVIALAASLYYTPDYLHLTVNPEKRARWEIKARWRVLAGALIVGVLSVSSVSESKLRSLLTVVTAIAWLGGANFLATKRPVDSRWLAAYFWGTDFLLVAG